MKIDHVKDTGPVQSVDDAIRNLKYPRVTESMIDQEIEKAECLVFPGTTVTICCLTLKNGYTVIGKSACAHPDNFDQEIGQNLAIQDAKEQMWALLGFRLRDSITEQNSAKGEPGHSLPPVEEVSNETV